MTKNIVVCCDGTGNRIEHNISNVQKLFRVLAKNERQKVYYIPGVGTFGSSNSFIRAYQLARATYEQLLGAGIDENIIAAYDFICRAYEDGDSIFLFGFSRGAYTVRALAGIIHLLGLLPPDQLNLTTYAVRCYQADSVRKEPLLTLRFSKDCEARHVPIKFLGLWDTVASHLVPYDLGNFIDFILLYTDANPSVEAVRHATSIDEQRRMFRLFRWRAAEFVSLSALSKPTPQDVKQVWFAGVHADVGGGYPEEEAALSWFSLNWMIREASAFGLLTREHAACRQEKLVVHNSLTWPWMVFEMLPKGKRYREWPGRKAFAGFYDPAGEPRLVDDGQSAVHESVRMAVAELPNYRPPNLPTSYTTELM